VTKPIFKDEKDPSFLILRIMGMRQDLLERDRIQDPKADRLTV